MNDRDRTIDEIRKFNRFYTTDMGFLNEKYLNSSYSMTETRILFEIKTRKTCIQSDIVKAIHIDKSYLSRIMQRLCKREIIEKIKSDDDKRAVKITLTEKGNEETERLIELTKRQIEAKITSLSTTECDKLCSAMNTVISILEKERR